MNKDQQSKRQKQIRLSDASRRKLADLKERYGTDTGAIEVAIDRLWRAECQPQPELVKLVKEEA